MQSKIVHLDQIYLQQNFNQQQQQQHEQGQSQSQNTSQHQINQQNSLIRQIKPQLQLHHHQQQNDVERQMEEESMNQPIIHQSNFH